MSESGERKIALAAIAGAHGIKGELRLKLFAERADSLARHKKLYVGGAERHALQLELPEHGDAEEGHHGLEEDAEAQPHGTEERGAGVL